MKVNLRFTSVVLIIYNANGGNIIFTLEWVAPFCQLSSNKGSVEYGSLLSKTK